MKFQVNRGIVVIPKSGKESRMKSNFDLFSWEMNDEDMKELENMNQNLRGWTEERVIHSKYFPF